MNKTLRSLIRKLPKRYRYKIYKLSSFLGYQIVPQIKKSTENTRGIKRIQHARRGKYIESTNKPSRKKFPYRCFYNGQSYLRLIRIASWLNENIGEERIDWDIRFVFDTIRTYIYLKQEEDITLLSICHPCNGSTFYGKSKKSDK